jgi:hypothetical protein
VVLVPAVDEGGQARGRVRHADGTGDLVDVLAARPLPARLRPHLDLPRVERLQCVFRRQRQHGHGHQRSLPAAVRLARRHPLHAVPARLVAEGEADAPAGQADGGVAVSLGEEFVAEAAARGVPEVGGEEFPGEQAGVAAALPGPEFEDNFVGPLKGRTASRR